MGENYQELAKMLTVTLSPFLPFLVDLGKASAKKLAEVIAENGGEAIWKKSQAIWKEISIRYKDDPEVESASIMVANKPDDAKRREILADVLTLKFQSDPNFAENLIRNLGGNDVIQRIVSNHESWVQNIVLETSGNAEITQTIEADNNSTIKDVTIRKH